MVRDTSIEAYRQIKNSGRLSELQWLVYSILYQFGPLSRSETAAKIVGSTRDGVHQRFAELRRFGLIKQVGKRICTITGKKVYIWDVTSKIPAESDFKIIPVWPLSYHVTVMPDNEWVYFTGESASTDAIAHCNDQGGLKVLELKGKIIFRPRGGIGRRARL